MCQFLLLTDFLKVILLLVCLLHIRPSLLLRKHFSSFNFINLKGVTDRSFLINNSFEIEALSLQLTPAVIHQLSGHSVTPN